MTKPALVFLFILLTGMVCTEQHKIVSKKHCGTDNRSKLYLSLKMEKETLFSKGFYELEGFTTLNDSIKLEIIKELLEYEEDTTRCCLRVSGYLYNIGNCGGTPTSTYYTIQIDALFMINRLCFSNLTDLYSCHPVLYDTFERREINDKPKLIKNVYAEYRKWYEEAKRQNKIDKYFPFNDGRYVWYGGKKSVYPKNETN